MAAPPKENAFPAYAPRVASEFRASLLQIPLFGDENMLIQAVNLHPTVPAEVIMTGRLWSDGERQEKYWQERFTCAANGGAGLKFVVLERGAILSFRISTDTAGITTGDVWVRVVLQKGFTGGLIFQGTIVQGYIGNFEDLSWPGRPLGSLTDGPGAIRTVAWTQQTSILLRATVPASRRWRVLSSFATVSTDATATVRSVQLFVTSGGAIIFGSEAANLQGASTSVFYTLAPGMAPTPAALQVINLIPFFGDLELRAGDNLEWTINGGIGADSITSGGVQVREWFTP
jgi:hypothetical protein